MNPKKQYYENAANTILRNLEKRQMKGFYCADVESAGKKLREIIPEGSSIGWGGSMTLNETGIMSVVCDGTYTVLDREKAKTKEEQKKIYGEICGCDYFLMSTNAITLNGELVNVDGRGNRVSFLCFGPEHVVVVAGMNKVVTDVDEGIKRARNMAAPPNAVRLNRSTPCTVSGKCADCLAPDSICSQTVITRRSHVPERIIVILVGEELGY